MKKELYGKTKDGKEVILYTVENKNGMEMSVMNYGAILVNVIVLRNMCEKSTNGNSGGTRGRLSDKMS